MEVLEVGNGGVAVLRIDEYEKYFVQTEGLFP